MKELLKFETSWCSQCKAINPTLDKVLKEFPDVKLTKINCEEQEDLPNRYNIRNLPTLIYLKNNIEVGRLIGNVSANKIIELLNE